MGSQRRPRVSGNEGEEREGKRCAGRCFEILSDWWMRLLRGGKRRGIRRKTRTRRVYLVLAPRFPHVVLPFCPASLFLPFPFSPVLFRTLTHPCVSFLRNFKYVVHDHHDQCRFLSHRRTDAWDRKVQL